MGDLLECGRKAGVDTHDLEVLMLLIWISLLVFLLNVANSMNTDGKSFVKMLLLLAIFKFLEVLKQIFLLKVISFFLFFRFQAAKDVVDRLCAEITQRTQ